MADDGSKDKAPDLPPKLDLRKTGVLRGHIYAAPGEESAPDGGNAAAQPGPESAPAKPAAPEANAEPKPETPAAQSEQITASEQPAKPSAAKPGEQPAEPKPVEAPSEPKPVAPPPSQPEPAEPKPAAPQPAEPRPVKPPPSQPQASQPQASGSGPEQKKPASGGEEAPRTPTLKAKPIVRSKKDTSRIPLDLAKPGPTKTIKIKPAMPPGAVKPQGAADETAPPPAEKGDEADSAKRKTSRIPLESALASGAEKKQSAQAPKTIRLKRPTGAGTVKTASGATAPKKPEAGGGGDDKSAALSKTSRLDHAAVDTGEAATPTRKKTIRVKRPAQRQAAKSLAVSRPEGAAQPAGEAAAQPAAAPAPAKVAKPVGWFSVTCGIAATLVTGVIIYLFLVQAFGPNASLTELSYGAPGMDLVWPGEIQAAP